MADSTAPKLKAEALFDLMKAHLTTDAGKEITKRVGYVYQLNIAPKKLGLDEQVYIIDLKKGEITKGSYEGGKPDATFSFTDEDFIKIATGKMNPQIAFLRGAIKLKGSLSAAQKFTPDIFPKDLLATRQKASRYNQVSETTLRQKINMPYFPKTASFTQNSSPPATEDLKSLLLNLEQRKNVKLTQKEVKELFDGLGSRWSSWRAWRAMRYADENGDGIITHNEMKQLLKYCKKHGFVQNK